MYDLHKLGWNSFQQLCLTIASEILGQTVEIFPDSHDGGRDGAFTGNWTTTGPEDLKGPLVIQCKFTSKVNNLLRTTQLEDEAKKAERLVEKNLCESYVLMTNAGVTGTENEEIVNLYKSVGVKYVRTFDSTWINQQIRTCKRLRMLVPRIYGLGDLSQILDDRAYDQARTILDSMREDLAKVVVTDAYQRAVEAIDRHSFVLLLGEPAAGKTTIASLLAMASLDNWNASVLKLDDPGKVTEHWNPNEPSQFFWLDDAFGVTQYEDFLVRRWNHILPNMRSMLRRKTKIVMTSRDYIYSRARTDLKESAFPLLNESQVVIDVQKLSIADRKQILYNHVKLGNQPRAFRTKIKPYLEGIASHQRFIPETARRLADPLFTKDLNVNEFCVREFVEKREEQLLEILKGLDVDSRTALALIYMRKGRLDSPINLLPTEKMALERLGSGLGMVVSALEALRGSLVRLSQPGDEPFWEYKHPTIGDGYAALLSQSPEHIGIFVQGSQPEKLVNQVTCGDVGIENAIVVPKALFPEMIAKLEEVRLSEKSESSHRTSFVPMWKIHGFLASRCTKDFLSLYLQEKVRLPRQFEEQGPYLNVVPDVRLAKTMHEFGLLPDEQRRNFVKVVSNYTLEGWDVSALEDADIRTLFTENEFKDLIQRTKYELLPRLDEVRWDWEFNYSSEELPEDYMQPLFEILDTLKAQFGDEENMVRVIDRVETDLYEWIHDNTFEESEEDHRQLGNIAVPDMTQGRRNIFDDIDAEMDPEIG